MADTLPQIPETDERLLTRLREGERDVFGPLVRRYERELYGYLRRYVGDDDLADDVFQNTFVQVFLKLAKGETAGEIAKALSLSVKTVSTYRTRLMEKMNLASNSDLTYYALKNKLID